MCTQWVVGAERPDAALAMLLDRIRKAHNIKLKAENRRKMHLYFKALLGLFLKPPAKRGRGGTCEEPSEALASSMTFTDVMTLAVFMLAKDMPNIASHVFLDHFVKMQRRLSKDLSEVANADSPNALANAGLRSFAWPLEGGTEPALCDYGETMVRRGRRSRVNVEYDIQCRDSHVHIYS